MRINFVYILINFFIVAYMVSFNNGLESDENIKKVLNKLVDTQNYDVRIRPNYVGPATKVFVDATIQSFSNLDAIKNMYTVDMFFRQRWEDPRLKHDMEEEITIIPGVQHPADIIWVPDTVFINSVVSSMHHVTVNNHKLDIYPNGTVFWGMRVTVSPSCYLDLKAYPMDKQTCTFEIVSYTYDNRHLQYKWFKNPGLKIEDRLMAQFELTDYDTSEFNSLYVAGNFSKLVGVFNFQRLMGFAILQIYAPSIAIVCVSWVSLWIRKTATPGRVALCITTLLTISTIWASVNATLPKVSYVKAIDVFLLTSFCCVIMTLLEYTIVLNCGKIMSIVRKTTRTKKDKSNRIPKTGVVTMLESRGMMWQSLNTTGVQETIQLTQNGGSKVQQKKKNPNKVTFEEIEVVADRIEAFARIFFPLLYISFNIIYWTKYLT